MLAGAAAADEAVLRAPVALDFGVLEGRPVRFAVAEAQDVALGDLVERKILQFGRFLDAVRGS